MDKSSKLSPSILYAFSKLALVILVIALASGHSVTRAAPAATITVDTTADELDGSPGNGACSLREAIANANNDNNAQADCTAGSGADIITFSAGIAGGTIILGGTQLAIIGGNVTITGPSAGMTIDGNNTTRVFYVVRGTLEMSNLTITNGNAAYGGGISVRNSILTLNYCTVTGNTATSSVGGGVEFGSMIHGGDSNLTINTSTISGNAAGLAGGGIADYYYSGTNTLTINNSTIISNTAPAGTGGGLDIYSSGTTVTIANTIIANSITTADDCYRINATLTSQGYNLVESPDASCIFTATGDFTGSDPLLLPLADNGGPTQTHFPERLSPILDAGSCTTGTDQRGLSRPVDLSTSGMYPNTDNGCDIGAVEAQGEMANAVTLRGLAAGSPVSFGVAAFAGVGVLAGSAGLAYSRRRQA